MKRLTGTTPRWRVTAVLLALAGIAVFASIALAAPGKSTRATQALVGDIWGIQSNPSVPIGFNVNPFGVILGQISPPAGTYLVTAKISVSNPNAGADFECHIYDTNGNIDDAGASTSAAFDKSTIALQSLVTYNTKMKLTLNCTADNNSAASWWRLDAVKIGEVY